mgnify:CR=1 FL=1
MSYFKHLSYKINKRIPNCVPKVLLIKSVISQTRFEVNKSCDISIVNENNAPYRRVILYGFLNVLCAIKPNGMNSMRLYSVSLR